MPPRRRPRPAGARTDLPPLKIIRKIFLLQLGYYAAATALILFTTLVYGTAFSFDLLLNWDAVRGDTTIGWILGLVWMLNSLLWYYSLLSFVAELSSKMMAYVDTTSQCNSPSPPCLAVQTHPRFRLHHTLRPPHRNIPLHTLHPRKLALVGSPMRQCSPDDLPGHVGLSVARTAAH